MKNDKTDVPRSFGIFKPVGHTVICFPNSALLTAAEFAFREKGFAESDLTLYTPQEMINQVEAGFIAASPIAEFGQELNLSRSHLLLAKDGCSFLVVHAPDKQSAAIVDDLIEMLKPISAQRYGLLIIEELVTPEVKPHQRPESLDRGLDAKSSSNL